jgi:hypothetical protein
LGALTVAAAHRTMLRCEVMIPRTGGWLVLDESPRPTTQRAYRKAMLKAHPILKSRMWRIVPNPGKKPARTLFTMTVPLGGR